MVTNLNLPKEPTFRGPAAIWKRAAAFAIDLFILDFVAGLPFRSIVNKIIPGSAFSQSYNYISTNPRISAILSLVMFIMGILALIYFSVLEYKSGQTPGKMFMNIKVEGKRNNFLDYIVRNMYFLLIFPFILLWIIDPLFLLFTKEKRRLSEILSGTKTVEVYSLR